MAYGLVTPGHAPEHEASEDSTRRALVTDRYDLQGADDDEDELGAEADMA